MEDQVAQAASAMVSPVTDPTTRRQASQFLEEWTKTPEAWDVYARWLQSYRAFGGPKSSDQVAMQLLCCTMLQTKLRKELPRQQSEAWHASVSQVRQELWEYMRQPSLDPSLIMPCCICNAIIIVRFGIVQEFISHISGGNTTQDMLPEISLRLLGCIPMEMVACQDLSGSEVTEQLVPFIEPVLDTIRRRLVEPSTSLQACQALEEWATMAHISLSQLNTPTLGGPHALLPTLLSLLSTSNCQHEGLLVMGSKAVTAAIMVVNDHCTPTREVSAAILWNAIPHGFIVAPLQLATQNEWHDACHALATLICTFVNEQVDDLVSQPADAGLQLLLDIQAHPHTPVALIPLDCWLTIQEVPMNARHDDWKRPLFRKVVMRLLGRMAYPASFVTWEEESEVDESEFQEFRRLMTDVLVSCYFLLRVELVQVFTSRVRSATHWTESEAALTSLTTISKDVSARGRAHGGTSIVKDRDTTCQELLQLLDELLQVDGRQQHVVMLEAILNFCGFYSPAWNSMNCPPQAILQLLSYLQSNFCYLPRQSAKAIRAVYVSCLAKSMPSIDDLQGNSNNNTATFLPMILKSLGDSMKAALLSTEEDASTMVAEGAIRLVTKLKDPSLARHALVNDMVNPVVERGYAAMQSFPTGENAEAWYTPQINEEAMILQRCLATLQVIVRFCDAPHIPTMGEWLLQEIGPFLQTVQQKAVSTPISGLILPKWMSIHQQLLRTTLPEQSVMISILNDTIPMVVQALEHTKDPSTLRYISAAVECFGGYSTEMEHSFQELLSHVTTVVTNQGNLAEATELLQAYFECLQRYVLFCPSALCYNSQITTIIALAVESTTALQGAKESTRAALLFLSQLFGWNALRLTPQSLCVLQDAWDNVLQRMLLHHGAALTQVCVQGLAGGSQMLWPAYSDCLFAIALAASLSTNTAGSESLSESATAFSESIVQEWLFAGMSSVVPPESRVTPDTCKQVISILLSFARQGSKSRAKAKMLLADFAKILKGEMAPTELVSYTLN